MSGTVSLPPVNLSPTPLYLFSSDSGRNVSRYSHGDRHFRHCHRHSVTDAAHNAASPIFTHDESLASVRFIPHPLIFNDPLPFASAGIITSVTCLKILLETMVNTQSRRTMDWLVRRLQHQTTRSRSSRDGFINCVRFVWRRQTTGLVWLGWRKERSWETRIKAFDRGRSMLHSRGETLLKCRASSESLVKCRSSEITCHSLLLASNEPGVHGDLYMHGA